MKYGFQVKELCPAESAIALGMTREDEYLQSLGCFLQDGHDPGQPSGVGRGEYVVKNHELTLIPRASCARVPKAAKPRRRRQSGAGPPKHRHHGPSPVRAELVEARKSLAPKARLGYLIHVFNANILEVIHGSNLS